MPDNDRKNRLIIIGASGHGKVVADIAVRNGYTDIVFLDNDETLYQCAGYPVQGRDDLAESMDGFLFIAIGNTKNRRKLMEKYQHRKFPVLVHPKAVVADGVHIGEGSVLMAGTVVNPGTVIGKGCIINTCASIDHDCKIGDYVHVAVGSHICGTVEVGADTWIGAGSIVSNNVHICRECVIGAGATVIKDIEEADTYIGIPAKKMMRQQEQAREYSRC